MSEFECPCKLCARANLLYDLRVTPNPHLASVEMLWPPLRMGWILRGGINIVRVYVRLWF